MSLGGNVVDFGRSVDVSPGCPIWHRRPLHDIPQPHLRQNILTPRQVRQLKLSYIALRCVIFLSFN
jgi:hypothetical protein